MRLADYLRARDEAAARFASRAGLPQRTVASIVNGSGCRVDTAAKIVAASKAKPAPCGGTVEYDDLRSQAPA